MSTIILNKLIEDFNNLHLDEKEYALEIIKKQFIEIKRNAIAKRYKEAMNNYKKGAIKKGTTKDLYKDLESD